MRSVGTGLWWRITSVVPRRIIIIAGIYWLNHHCQQLQQHNYLSSEVLADAKRIEVAGVGVVVGVSGVGSDSEECHDDVDPNHDRLSQPLSTTQSDSHRTNNNLLCDARLQRKACIRGASTFLEVQGSFRRQSQTHTIRGG